MSATPPRISVIVAAYNTLAFVDQALESLLFQDYPETEIVVVDDGSTDGTADRLTSYGERIVLIRQRNKGAVAARNRAWQRATGEFVKIFDSDDRLTPGALSRQANFLAANDHVDVVYGETQTIDAEGRALGLMPLPVRLDPESDPLETLVTRNIFPVHAALARRRAFERLGSLHEEDADVVADWDLWRRVAEGSRFAFHPGVIAEYRIHPQMSVRRISRMRGLCQTRNTLTRAIEGPGFSRLRRAAASRSYLALSWACVRIGDADTATRVLSGGLSRDPSSFGLIALERLFSRTYAEAFRRTLAGHDDDAND